MRVERRRKKKLIVAFHFQHANQAAWKCDACRASGLETRRRCGWLEREDGAGPPVVWARGKAATSQCPISYITSESRALVEEFNVWKMFGTTDYVRLPARLVEAIFILENELRMEQRDGDE